MLLRYCLFLLNFIFHIVIFCTLYVSWTNTFFIVFSFVSHFMSLFLARWRHLFTGTTYYLNCSLEICWKPELSWNVVKKDVINQSRLEICLNRFCFELLFETGLVSTRWRFEKELFLIGPWFVSVIVEEWRNKKFLRILQFYNLQWLFRVMH